MNIINKDNLSQKEVDAYVEELKRRHPDKVLTEVTLSLDGDEVKAEFKYDTVEFERIRRITGYLVGTLDRFNDAKKAEVNDRVKHM